MKKKGGIRVKRLVAFFCLFWPFMACAREARPLSQQYLFSLKRGFLPGEVGLAPRGEGADLLLGRVGLSPSAVVYLSDPVSRKLMVLSNYGDLLHVFFNPEDNLWQNQNIAADFTPWPFQDLQHVLATNSRVYVADGRWPDDKVEVFGHDGEHLFSLFPRERSVEASMVRGLREDSQGAVVVVHFSQSAWQLNWYSQRGQWLNSRSLPYEKEGGQGTIELISSVWPAFAPWNVFYQKMSYAAEGTGFLGGSGTWGLKANEVWAYNVETRDHRLLFTLKDDYLDATLLGLLNDDSLVVVYHQGGKMVVAPYSQGGERGRAAALAIPALPTSYALSPSGVLLAVEYQGDQVKVGWWRLDQFWGEEGG